MNSQQWAELLRYSSPNSILIITWNNKLRELKCPFTVIVRYNIGELKIDSQVKVLKVKISTSMITVFVIQNKPYYYHHFKILW